MFTDDDSPYRVLVEPFAESHFIRDFKKKYKSNWDTTRKAIVAQLSNIDLLVKAGRIPSAIHKTHDGHEEIFKHSFAVAGRNESPKSSGNRIILYVNHDLRTVRILLVYSKNDISTSNETAKWRSIVNDHYGELMKSFKD